MSSEDFIPIGWLSPEGKLYKCDMYDHIAVAEDICRDVLNEDNYATPDETLLNRGWVHLTFILLTDPGWAVIFPYSNYLSEEQRSFLKPYVEEYKDLLSPLFNRNLKREFSEYFFD